MVKKRAIKSGSGVEDNTSSKSFYTKLSVIGIVVILVLGIFLFAGLRGVGKAWVSASESDPFYNAGAATTGEEYQGVVYYEEVPQEDKDEDDEGDTESQCKKKTDCDENCPYPSQQAATYCYSTTADTWTCYPPSSVTRTSNQDSVCVDPSNYNTYKNKNEYTGLTDGTYNGYNWLDCKDGVKKTTVLDGKFFCTDDKKFLPCVEDYDGVYKKDANNVVKFLCVASSKKWVTCDAQLTTKIQLDKFLCNSSNKWQECTSIKTTSNKKYYCEYVVDKWKWNECNGKNELSADGKQYCQQEGTMWKWNF